MAKSILYRELIFVYINNTIRSRVEQKSHQYWLNEKVEIVYTGRCKLRHHIHRIGLAEIAKCRQCTGDMTFEKAVFMPENLNQYLLK